MPPPSHHSRGPVAFNMTPMIDVVFLLIIFFLVSSHLAKQETQLQLDLPVADTGAAEQEKDLPRVTVNVLEDGSLTIAGRKVAESDLVDRLKQKRAREGGDLEVRVRSDRSVPFRQIAPILSSCTDAGVWNVNFSVYRSQDVPAGAR